MTQRPSLLKRHFRGHRSHRRWLGPKLRWVLRLSALAIATGWAASNMAQIESIEPMQGEPKSDNAHDLVSHYAGPYEHLSQQHQNKASFGSQPLVGHMESEYLGNALDGRHAQVATEAFDIAADITSGGNITSTWIRLDMDEQTPHSMTILKEASVMSTSKGGAYGYGTRYDIEKADEFWRDTDVITLSGAGNEGGICPTELDYMQPIFHVGHLLRNDAHLSVGAADVDQILDYSSCSGPDIVAPVPFRYGAQYKQYPSYSQMVDALHQSGWNRLSAHIGVISLLAREFSALTLLETFVLGNELVDGIEGTSFSGPAAGGMIAAIRTKYPSLTADEVITAVLTTARPIEKIEGSDDKLIYHDNGRGLDYNLSRGGFGMIDPEAAMRAAAHIKQLKTTSPPKQGISVLASAEVNSVSPQKTVIEFNIDESVTITNLAIRINLSGKWPDEHGVHIQRPDGMIMTLSPGIVSDNDGQNLWVDARTRQPFGTDIRGTWRLYLAEQSQVSDVSINFSGVLPGGVIDRYLDLKSCQNKPVKKPIKKPWLSRGPQV